MSFILSAFPFFGGHIFIGLGLMAALFGSGYLIGGGKEAAFIKKVRDDLNTGVMNAKDVIKSVNERYHL